MGKRTIRLRKQDLPEKLLEVEINTEIQVVLSNGKTLSGKMMERNQTGLTIQSGNPAWYNTKAHLQVLFWQDIIEVEYDLPTFF